MKLAAIWFCFSGLAVEATSAPFQNLGFDNADTNNVTGPFGQFGGFVGVPSELLPGWQVSLDETPVEIIGWNLGLVATAASLFGDNGSYVLAFLPGFTAGTFSLAQRGDLPAGARLIQFLDSLDLVNNVDIQLKVNDVDIPLKPQFTGFHSDFTLVTGDISAFAGRNVELRFLTTGPSRIDSISFVVPEPLFLESDFNGDGVPDLVFEHQDGFIGVWFMNNGPDLISASYFNPQAVADPRWHVVGNHTDLLFQHEDSRFFWNH